MRLSPVAVCAVDSYKPHGPHSFFLESCSSHRAALQMVALSSKFVLRGQKNATRGDTLSGAFSLKIALLLSEGYSAFRQVVRGHLYHNFISWQDPNEMQSHFPGDMCQNPMSVGQLHLEQRIWQALGYLTLNFDDVSSRHVNISGSPFVTKTVCSKCAEGK